MAHYIQPDVIIKVPIIGSELTLSPGYDVIHMFQPLGKAMLKYWNDDIHKMCNVLLDADRALALASVGRLAIVQRDFIMTSEHNQLVSWQADMLNDQDFGL